MWKSLFLILCLLLSGCAVNLKKVPRVKNLPDASAVQRFRKPSVTIDFEYQISENNEKKSASKTVIDEEFDILRENFKETRLFSRVVNWRKTSDIFITIELSKNSSKSQFWETVTETTLFLMPNFFKTTYKMKVTVFDDLHENIVEYSFEDGFWTLQQILLLPFAVFSHPPEVDKAIRLNLYKALLVAMVKDKIVSTTYIPKSRPGLCPDTSRGPCPKP